MLNENDNPIMQTMGKNIHNKNTTSPATKINNCNNAPPIIRHVRIRAPKNLEKKFEISVSKNLPTSNPLG